MKYFTIVFLFIYAFSSQAQNRNNIWCFGDSAGIDFNSGIPVPIVTGFDTRRSCVSIADTGGSLLFYANTRATLPGNTSLVWNKNNQLMQNGDSIVGRGWYNEIVIVPNPSNNNIFYVFSIGVTSIYGTYYSIVDLSQNGGLGAVTQKNILLQSFANTDCLNAIKHGNGRDWWVIFRKSGIFPGIANNQFYQYLITPNGISSVYIQSIGSTNSTNEGKITFSQNGDKMVYTNWQGLIELYDYDRCSGIISNPITIHPESISGNFDYIFSSEFSPNGTILYVTKTDNTSYLFQFDLTAPNILSTMDTLFVKGNPDECIGGLKRGPDGKICESGGYVNSAYFPYPYPDSVYNKYNKNLGVINYPDSLGAACDFQPWSFNLGGKRTYWGLPNNPDYDMGPIIGSACDTLRPVVNFVATDTSFCNNQCISFNDSSTKNPTRWQWFFTGALPDTSSQQNPTNICYNNPGSYDVKLIACNEVGCDTLLLSNYISVYPLPSIELGNDTSTCNIPVQLDAGAGNTGYQWSNGDITQIITAGVSASYTVTVTDANGCSNSDSVFVVINPLPAVSFNAFIQDTLCLSSGIQTISNGNPSGGSYTGTAVTGNLFNPAVAGVGLHYITYQYTDSLGCTNTVTDSVFVDVCSGIISITGNDEIKIFPNPASNSITIIAHHLKGTTYTLTVTDIIGRQVFKEKGGLHPLYFTKDLDCTNFSQGMYIITLITNKEQLSQKFIKE